MLLEDLFAREKIHHEHIPGRVVHTRGTGAFGKFTLFESAAGVTSAGVLTDTSRETSAFLQFSTFFGSCDSADTVWDVRGFTAKFYPQEGNWDTVGNNIPIFFNQDAIKFPDVIHAGKPEPHNEVPRAQTALNNFWDSSSRIRKQPTCSCGRSQIELFSARIVWCKVSVLTRLP